MNAAQRSQAERSQMKQRRADSMIVEVVVSSALARIGERFVRAINAFVSRRGIVMKTAFSIFLLIASAIGQNNNQQRECGYLEHRYPFCFQQQQRKRVESGASVGTHAYSSGSNEFTLSIVSLAQSWNGNCKNFPN